MFLLPFLQTLCFISLITSTLAVHGQYRRYHTHHRSPRHKSTSNSLQQAVELRDVLRERQLSLESDTLVNSIPEMRDLELFLTIPKSEIEDLRHLTQDLFKLVDSLIDQQFSYHSVASVSCQIPPTITASEPPAISSSTSSPQTSSSVYIDVPVSFYFPNFVSVRPPADFTPPPPPEQQTLIPTTSFSSSVAIITSTFTLVSNKPILSIPTIHSASVPSPHNSLDTDVSDLRMFFPGVS
ncbi:MAG: hypothetical protein M1834_008964 [Cirrosporium novae-zelandiae]|nr:MAG: hypothetical protein M1834_008964 [Cirrosporium novae-zelandiae]